MADLNINRQHERDFSLEIASSIRHLIDSLNQIHRDIIADFSILGGRAA